MADQTRLSGDWSHSQCPRRECFWAEIIFVCKVDRHILIKRKTVLMRRSRAWAVFTDTCHGNSKITPIFFINSDLPTFWTIYADGDENYT
jgi:hypothetical protein